MVRETEPCAICHEDIRPMRQLVCDAECGPDLDMLDYAENDKGTRHKSQVCTLANLEARLDEIGAVYMPCGHAFCAACIRTWVREQGRLDCPICRRALVKCMEIEDIKDLLDLNEEALHEYPFDVDRDVWIVAVHNLLNGITAAVAERIVQKYFRTEPMAERNAERIMDIDNVSMRPIPSRYHHLFNSVFELGVVSAVILEELMTTHEAKTLFNAWRGGYAADDDFEMLWNGLISPHSPIGRALARRIYGRVHAGGADDAKTIAPSLVTAGALACAVAFMCM